jgi:hypothetical protein
MKVRLEPISFETENKDSLTKKKRRVQSSEADLRGSVRRVGLESRRDSQVCQTRDQSLAAHNAAQHRHQQPLKVWPQIKCKLSQHRVGGEAAQDEKLKLL